MTDALYEEAVQCGLIAAPQVDEEELLEVATVAFEKVCPKEMPYSLDALQAAVGAVAKHLGVAKQQACADLTMRCRTPTQEIEG